MGKIASLLRWKSEIQLKNSAGELINADGRPLKEDEYPLTIYLRIVGDDDLAESYRLARIASAEKRYALTQKDTTDWKEASRPIMEADKDACLVLIKNARTSNLEAEARANTKRPELPDLEEFAVDPDAASLAEQEKFEAAIEVVDVEYEKAVQEYMDVRIKVIEAEINSLNLKEARETALDEVGTILALGEFYAELFDQKAARGSYIDNEYKEKAFDNPEEFKSADGIIKQQIIDAYLELEQSAGNIKK